LNVSFTEKNGGKSMLRLLAVGVALHSTGLFHPALQSLAKNVTKSIEHVTQALCCFPIGYQLFIECVIDGPANTPMISVSPFVLAK
jgi:hypothetical protein